MVESFSNASSRHLRQLPYSSLKTMTTTKSDGNTDIFLIFPVFMGIKNLKYHIDQKELVISAPVSAFLYAFISQ